MKKKNHNDTDPYYAECSSLGYCQHKLLREQVENDLRVYYVSQFASADIKYCVIIID